MQLILEIEPESKPVHGWVKYPDADQLRFTGLLELLAALERALEAPASAPPMQE